MQSILTLLADPAAWAALFTLIVMEVVLGIDNLVFVSILSNRLPPEQQTRARRIGISLALVLRLVLLSTIAWLVGLTKPVIDLGFVSPTSQAIVLSSTSRSTSASEIPMRRARVC
ncbi:MAG: Integral rane protein TerC, partial [Sphingomonas bacterium]|nr:Integral rane protein TerC [Sphingomonas bacterium]